MYAYTQTIENTEGAINNGQCRETGNMTKTNKNTTQYTLYVGYHYTQAITNKVNKT